MVDVNERIFYHRTRRGHSSNFMFSAFHSTHPMSSARWALNIQWGILDANQTTCQFQSNVLHRILMWLVQEMVDFKRTRHQRYSANRQRHESVSESIRFSTMFAVRCIRTMSKTEYHCKHRLANVSPSDEHNFTVFLHFSLSNYYHYITDSNCEHRTWCTVNST